MNFDIGPGERNWICASGMNGWGVKVWVGNSTVGAGVSVWVGAASEAVGVNACAVAKPEIRGHGNDSWDERLGEQGRDRAGIWNPAAPQKQPGA